MFRCKLLFTGENSTRLACRTIAYTSKGRGYTLPIDAAVEVKTREGEQCVFLDQSLLSQRYYPGVFLLKPMREFLAKDIAVYNRFTQLDTVYFPTLTTKCSMKASIDRLTEEFVVGLQHEYPSTVPTIMRTVSKLAPGHNPAEDSLCQLCKG
jgi:cytoplasmic tRNA 2-thiolation protein 2